MDLNHRLQAQVTQLQHQVMASQAALVQSQEALNYCQRVVIQLIASGKVHPEHLEALRSILPKPSGGASHSTQLEATLGGKPPADLAATSAVPLAPGATIGFVRTLKA